MQLVRMDIHEQAVPVKKFYDVVIPVKRASAHPYAHGVRKKILVGPMRVVTGAIVEMICEIGLASIIILRHARVTGVRNLASSER